MRFLSKYNSLVSWVKEIVPHENYTYDAIVLCLHC
jgi:hypothetical protein